VIVNFPHSIILPVALRDEAVKRAPTPVRRFQRTPASRPFKSEFGHRPLPGLRPGPLNPLKRHDQAIPMEILFQIRFGLPN
jgi:hypothetical protein